MECCFCKKEFEGYGNNALPVREGICCDTCNLQIVVPARLEKNYIDDLKNTDTYKAPEGEIFTDEVFFEKFGIRDNDRLKNYQLVKRYWEAKMNYLGADADDLIGKEQMNMLKVVWKRSYKASMDEAKPFTVEEDVVPLLLHTECTDGELPFNSVFIDAKVQIKNRTYFGFHIGSYYTEKGVQYKAILTVYSKFIKHNGEMVKFLIPDFILLKKSSDDEDNLPFRKSDYYHNKIKSFIFSFCAFINEPDVVIMEHPLNPKNNVRRIERGLMPLPEYKNAVIRGKLRIYVDKQREHTGANSPFMYRFWVRGFYRHFFDKKKYARIYALTPEEIKKAGLTYSEKHKDILRKWIKPFIKGQGILIKQSWEVIE